MVDYPKPTEPKPIYGGKVEPIRLYIDGKEVTFEENIEPVMHGIFDTDTCTVKWRINNA